MKTKKHDLVKEKHRHEPCTEDCEEGHEKCESHRHKSTSSDEYGSQQSEDEDPQMGKY